MEPVYRVAQRFLKVQAVSTVGTRHGDFADPLSLEVVLTQGDTELDRVVAASAGQTSLWPVRTGNWVYQIPAGLLTDGLPYSVAWRYEMTPNNINVRHQTFVWRPVPAVPRDTDKVVLYGLLADTAGQPMSDHRLVLETYADARTLTTRTGSLELTTDPFGIWHIELPKGQVVRLVFNELSKVVRLPADTARVALSELAPYQPEQQSENLDRYGYPRP